MVVTRNQQQGGAPESDDEVARPLHSSACPPSDSACRRDDPAYLAVDDEIHVRRGLMEEWPDRTRDDIGTQLQQFMRQQQQSQLQQQRDMMELTVRNHEQQQQQMEELVTLMTAVAVPKQDSLDKRRLFDEPRSADVSDRYPADEYATRPQVVSFGGRNEQMEEKPRCRRSVSYTHLTLPTNREV